MLMPKSWRHQPSRIRRCHHWLQGSEPGRAQYIGEVIEKAMEADAERRQELRDRFRADDQQDRLREMRDERFI